MLVTVRRCQGCESELPSDADPRKLFCADHCRWRAKARRKGSCSSCGRPVGRSRGSAAEIVCHPCRRIAAGRAAGERATLVTSDERQSRWLFCPTCDRFFDTEHPTKKYCSPGCRDGRARDRPAKQNLHEGRRVRVGREWVRLRGQVIEQESHCWLCGELVDKARRWPDRWSASVDHVVPIAKGGAELDRDNLRLAHLFCNLSRGQRAPRRAGRPPSAVVTSST